MSEITPITREEKLWNGEDLEPLTREEMYIKRIFDKTQAIPDKPLTRKEILMEKAGEGGGGDVTIKQLSVTANGTYSEEGTAYSPVVVNVPTPENAYLLKEASGSLVSFNDGADLPMPSFVCNIDAVQDLHGYDAPWVGGAGKNKLQVTATSQTINGVTFTVNDDGTITANGTAGATANISFTVGEFLVDSNSCIVNGVYGGGAYTYYLQIINEEETTQIGVTFDGDNTISIPANTKYKVRIRILSGVTVNNLVFKPMIRLATETDATYAPYSNICPISGHTGVDAWVRGKNLLPMTVDGIKTANGGANTWTNNEKTINGITFTILTNNVGEIIGVNANGTATADAVVTILVDTSKVYGDLYFVGCNGGSNNTYNALMWDATTSARAKKWDGTTASNNSVDGAFQQVKIVQGNNVKFQLRVMNGKTVNNVIFQPMICLSTETDQTFAPYNPQSQTIQVSWQTEAGEVYGGEIDLVSGVLTVTDGYIASYDGEILPSTWISDSDVYAEGTTPTTGAEVVYKLAEAQTYQLDGNQIKSLLGSNNAWCDTGDIDIDYFAKEVTG